MDLKNHRAWASLESSMANPTSYFQHNCIQIGVLLQPERVRKDSFKDKTLRVKTKGFSSSFVPSLLKQTGVISPWDTEVSLTSWSL